MWSAKKIQTGGRLTEMEMKITNHWRALFLVNKDLEKPWKVVVPIVVEDNILLFFFFKDSYPQP